MIREWLIYEPKDGPVRHCIVALAGRGNTASYMAQIANDLQLPNTLVVAMRPHGYAWYPMPINSFDQDDAVRGLPLAVKAVDKRIKSIRSSWRLKNKDICLLGFSAGSVVSIQLAALTSDPFAGVVSLAGAVLEPHRLPKSDGRETAFMLQHNEDDSCFDWFERYLPMRDGLINKGYNVWTLEKPWGNHQVMARDIVSISNHIGPLFGYEDWRHEESKLFRAMELTNQTKIDAEELLPAPVAAVAPSSQS